MPGYSEDKAALLTQLRRIEGQVRGLQRQVRRGHVLHRRAHPGLSRDQALQSVALELLDDHLEHCLCEALAGGGSDADPKVAEASAAIARLVKS